jgi:hypothetical protein
MVHALDLVAKNEPGDEDGDHEGGSQVAVLNWVVAEGRFLWRGWRGWCWRHKKAPSRISHGL